MYKVIIFCYSWKKNITEVHPFLVKWEKNNEKQVDNHATCKEKKTTNKQTDILFSFPLL